jgi:translation initiation factor eIF-2B subunit epsilon
MAKKTAPTKNTWEREVLQAVVIADSFNVRFAPLTLDRPRALIPLAGMALLDHTLNFLEKARVDEVIIFCCAFSKKIQDHVAQSSLCAFNYHHSNNTDFVKEGKFGIQFVISQRSLSFGDALREIYQSGLIRSEFILV